MNFRAQPGSQLEEEEVEKITEKEEGVERAYSRTRICHEIVMGKSVCGHT